MAFELDPRLSASSLELGTFRGCRVLLKNNAHYFWFLLVPEVDRKVTELHELPAPRYKEVCAAIRELSTWVKGTFKPDKLNVAAIGNIVSQLHVHIVGRMENDVAWPGTVWACEEKKAYSLDEIRGIQKRFNQRFG